jgi:hypothetical protein
MFLDNPFSMLENWLDSESTLPDDALESKEPSEYLAGDRDPLQTQDSHEIEGESLSDNIVYYDPECHIFSLAADSNLSQFDGWGTPIEDANCWQQQEGSNSCAVVAQIGVYESITGVDISEVQACQIAQANGWYDPEIGTIPEHVGKILNELGIPTWQSYDATLDDIATALEQGDKVIVGLDGNEIWKPVKDPVTGSPIEQSDAGHAVWVTGIDRQPDGSVKIILNDSGTANGQMMAVDAEDFLNSWADLGNFLVVADAPDDSNLQLA